MASRAARNVSPATEPVRLAKGGNAGGNWIKNAVKPANKGKFSAKAKAAGMSTSAYAKEKASAPGVLGKEARFAQTMEKVRPMKKAKGGKVHDDAGADKKLFMKMFKTEEDKEDAGEKPVKKARGGKMSKPRAPRAPKMPMPPQAPMDMPPPPAAMQGAPDPNQPFKKGGKTQKFAVGGVARIRLGMSTADGKQKPASVPKSNLI